MAENRLRTLLREVVNHACDLHPNGRLNAELAALLARDVGPPH